MRRIFAASAVLALLVLAGCGPGLVALGGGGTGAWFGISSGDDEKKDSGVVVAENFEPAVIITNMVREQSPALVNYSIIDPNADPCTIQFQYSLNGGTDYNNCTMGTLANPPVPGPPPGEPTTGLTSSAGGTPHTFRWDYLADIGTQLHQGVIIRARAQDGKQFGEWFNLPGQSVGNDGPTISSINLIGDTGVLLITFSVSDANNDLATLDIEWSIDQAQNWTSVDVGQEVLGNPPENLPSSPAPGSPGQVIWNSGVALNNFVGNVLLRFAPRDHPSGFGVPTPGTPSVAGPFALNNLTNQPPTLQMERSYTGQTYVSRVPIDFTVWDGESDATAVEVSYLLVGQSGAVFEPATMPGEFAAGIAGPFSTTPSPTLYSIQWDALADLGGLSGINTTGYDVQLRLRPADGGAGQEVFTDTFHVVGNTAPAIDAIQPLNNFGGVPIIFRAVDSSGDPVSITIEYSTNGTSYLPLTPADFVFGNPGVLESNPTGRDNLLVWDTLRQFSGMSANHANVLLRVRPTDHPVSATPSADLQGDFFVSGAFPIINDPGGASPVSVEIFTTNNGGPVPSSPQLVTVPLGGLRNFNRSVFPTSAVGFNTFWVVVEGPSYGTLKDLVGAPLAYATGFLTPNTPGSINSGDTFVLGDGINAPVTFEFIKTGSATGSNLAVNIQTAVTAAEVATAMVASINTSGLRLAASAAGSQVNLVHQFACNVGNAVSSGGNAPDIQFTGVCITTSSNLGGGIAPTEVRFEAPATAPTGSDRVTIRCAVDDPAHFNVQDSHVLHWGDIPASVLVNPTAPLVLVGTSVNFSAQVQPAGAPQGVTWEVVGGFANGTISIGGQYAAPATMPSSNQVTIRAHSVQAGVFGTAQVTLQPEPTSVTVSAAGNVSQLDLSVSPTQLSTLQFSAQVLPGNAPQGVNWRIFWNNSDYGTGNSTVGTISIMGVYTAPLTLPSPNSVSIQALSQVKPTVYGFRQLDLSAPPPTSFQVTPNPVQVYTNGQGVLFSAVNFAPANANTAVTWSLSQPTGFGSISPIGFYQPPTTYPGAAPLSAVATSALNGSVQALATITLLPPQATAPTSIDISPTAGLTTSSAFGPPLQFVSTVSPPQAQQGVTWSIVGTAIGSVTSTGKYTPGASTTDYVETIRAASTFPSSTVMQTVQVSVSGSGHSPTHVADVPMGRADATPVWDSQNNRMWFIGGASESSTPGHEVSVTWYSPAANQFGTGPSLVVPGNVIAIAGAFETTGSTKRLWAICSSGSASSPVLTVFHLNVATLPVPAAWTSVTVGGTSTNIPSLGSSVRYPCWYDSTPNQVCLMRDVSFVYRFTPGAASVTWSRQSVNSTGNGPEQFANSSFCWDDTTRKAYFVGPKERFTVLIIIPVHDGYSTALHVLDMVPSTPSWSIRNTSDAPTVGISNGTLFKGSAPNILWFFGGRNDDVSPAAYNNNLWRINVGVNPATFTQMTTSGAWPSARMSAAAGITTTPGGGVLLGGRNSAGSVHGDLWRFSETPSHFTRPSPAGIIPQGRSHAAGVVNAGRGFAYGGLTAVGVSNELWSFTLTGGVPAWVLETTSGTPPPGLIRASVVVDTVSQTLYLFGGTTSEKDAAANAIQDIYTLNLQTKAWSKPTPTGTLPSKRFGAALCASYNLTTGAVTALYMYGGQDATGLKGDLWRLTLSGTPAWQLVTPTNAAPDARHGATIGWDSRRDRLFVVGGFSTPSGANRQCHQYDLATNAWSSPPTDDNTQAEFVFESGAAYDVSLRRFFHAPAGKAKNQALVVTTINPTWQQLVSPTGGTSQNQMTGTTGLYDPVAGRYYAVFGERAVGARAVGTNGMRWLMVK